MFNPNTCVELRILGPDGKPYADLESKYIELFDEHGTYFVVPRLFSSPKKTSVAVAIGIGVITGSCTYLVQKLIDEIFFIQEKQPNTEIHITINNGDNHYFLEGDKSIVIQKIEEIKNNYVE